MLDNYRYDGASVFDISAQDPAETGEFKYKKETGTEFEANLKAIHRLQQRLYAEGKEGLIVVFQALDGAGKDGAIRTVFSRLTPHGVKEYSFRVPTREELLHDFLWRFWPALPSKGHISIFNRSYYEDVLVGKVHSLYLNQKYPDRIDTGRIIEDRYEYINSFERYLYNTGTRVVKIFLNISKDEQARRLISRIDVPDKNWKFSEGDIRERRYWDEYMETFETMINMTASEKSPWYAVPADHKWYARLIVSRIVRRTLEEMNPEYPQISDEERDTVTALRRELSDSLK